LASGSIPILLTKPTLSLHANLSGDIRCVYIGGGAYILIGNLTVSADIASYTNLVTGLPFGADSFVTPVATYISGTSYDGRINDCLYVQTGQIKARIALTAGQTIRFFAVMASGSFKS